ncbi:hypothetical protein [Streptomyces sp. NBC_01669]|nr:hypothetical protein [Streptomyces sp. NBC_01669]
MPGTACGLSIRVRRVGVQPAPEVSCSAGEGEGLQVEQGYVRLGG